MVLLLKPSLEQLGHFLLVFHDEYMHRRHTPIRTLQPENVLNLPVFNSRLFRPRMEREGMGGPANES
jgi:hypothetical protein